MKKGTLKLMLKAGLITETEILMSEVNKGLYDMFVAGVKLLEDVEREPVAQLKAYELKAAKGGRKFSVQIKKLKRVIEKGGYGQQDQFIKGVEARPTGAKTQKGEVLLHLQTKGSITSFEAFANYGVTRLAAIIHELRTKQGLNIETIKKKTLNRYNNITNYAKYKLLED